MEKDTLLRLSDIYFIGNKNTGNIHAFVETGNQHLQDIFTDRYQPIQNENAEDLVTRYDISTKNAFIYTGVEALDALAAYKWSKAVLPVTYHQYKKARHNGQTDESFASKYFMKIPQIARLCAIISKQREKERAYNLSTLTMGDKE